MRIFTVTGREGTGGSLLAHIETSEELDPQVRVNHVLHLDQIVQHVLLDKLKSQILRSLGRQPWVERYTAGSGRGHSPC